MTIPPGVPAGWILRETKQFATHVGPFYEPPGGDALQGCGFVASEKHGNKRGVVHGGMIATAFDVALGNATWQAADQRPCATIQLNIQYLGALKMGDFAFVQPTIVKVTRTLVFLRGTMTVGDRDIAAADGIWKILDWQGEPFKPT